MAAGGCGPCGSIGCTLQTDFGTIQGLADHGTVVGFNGTAQGTTFAASGIIVNCPIVAFASS